MEKFSLIAIIVFIENILEKALLIECVLLICWFSLDKFKPYLSNNLNLSKKNTYNLLSLIIWLKTFCLPYEEVDSNQKYIQVLQIIQHLLQFYLIFWLFLQFLIIKCYNM